ncbi:MAG: hypothetical protein J6C93_03585 [Clostridia bacterium]|nr:hypothetical protein [Clostridia bacterium]
MKKALIDFDGLFDEKLAQYMEENAEKYKEKQWEELIPKLYAKFGDTFVKSAQNTPKGFYREMSDGELVDCLIRHVEEDVPVSDFLCRELETRNCPDALLDVLKNSSGQLLTLAVNVAGGNERAFDAYLDLLVKTDDEDIKETVCDQLKSNADPAKERALALYFEGKEKELMLEILSRIKDRDDRVFEILLREFKDADEHMTMRASYLAAYGDARALDALLERIDVEEINYLEYQELKYAIEALGGEYTRPRDFTNDPYYQEVLAQSQSIPDPLATK